MAQLKYACENGVLKAWDKDDTLVTAAFNYNTLTDAIKTQLGEHGLKVVLQQRTSQLRGKATNREVLDAMLDVYRDLAAGEWFAKRQGGVESRKVKLAFALARVLLSLGKAKGSEGGIASRLLEKKMEELENVAALPQLRELVLAELAKADDEDGVTFDL